MKLSGILLATTILSTLDIASGAIRFVDNYATAPHWGDPMTTNGVLTSITIGETYSSNDIRMVSSVDLNGADLSSTWKTWATGGDEPFNVTTALTDPRLDTGSVGNSEVVKLKYNLNGPVADSDELFVFVNAGSDPDEITGITAYDSGGGVVGTIDPTATLGLDWSGNEIGSADLSRYRDSSGYGSDLTGRGIIGFAVSMSEFGGTVSNITSISFSSSNNGHDIQLVGHVSVPDARFLDGFSTMPAWSNPMTGNGVLHGITIGGVSYASEDLILVSYVDLNGADLTSTWRTWSTAGDDPLSVISAVTDNRVDSGSLGSSEAVKLRYYLNGSVTVSNQLFVFVNAGSNPDEISAVTAYDEIGTEIATIDLSTSLGSDWNGTQIGTANLSRYRDSSGAGSDLNGRNIIGFAVRMSAFGPSVSAIKSVSFSSINNGHDIQLVGHVGESSGGHVLPPLNAAYFAALKSGTVTSTPLVKWQQFGPGMSGYIDLFWINNGDPDCMYDELDMGNGHVTLNGGKYWHTYKDADGNGLPAGVTGIEFSYQDADFGFMMAKEGIYSTTNRGVSWDYLKDLDTSNSEMHSILAVDPVNNNNWYIGAGNSWNIKNTHYTKNGIDTGGNFSSGYILFTKNRWQTKTKVSSPFPSDSSFSRIIVDPRNSDIVYASCQHGVYKSTNGGTSWFLTPGTGLPHHQPRYMDSFYDSVSDEFYLYVLEITHYDLVGSEVVTSGGVYRSADGGSTWENLTGDLAIDMSQITQSSYLSKYYRAVAFWQETTEGNIENNYNLPTNTFSQFHQMAVDPDNKDRIYLVHNFKHDYSFPPGNIWMTENGGTNWYAAAREGAYWKNAKDGAYWSTRTIQPAGINTTFAHVELEHNGSGDHTGTGPRFVKCNQTR